VLTPPMKSRREMGADIPSSSSGSLAMAMPDYQQPDCRARCVPRALPITLRLGLSQELIDSATRLVNSRVRIGRGPGI